VTAAKRLDDLSLLAHTAPMKIVQEMGQGKEHRSSPHLQGPRVSPHIGPNSRVPAHARARTVAPPPRDLDACAHPTAERRLHSRSGIRLPTLDPLPRRQHQRRPLPGKIDMCYAPRMYCPDGPTLRTIRPRCTSPPFPPPRYPLRLPIVSHPSSRAFPVSACLFEDNH